MARSKATAPAAVSIVPGNKALQKALSTLFSDLRMIVAIKQAAEALAALLRKDAAALARTRSEVERLGRELAVHFAALGPNTRLDDFKSKPLRTSLHERYRQLDRLVVTLRLVGRQDDWLLTLADAVGDNTIRSVFAEALSGGQYGLRPVAPKKLLRWLDSRNSGARGTAQNALYRTDRQAAHARWREVLTTSHDAEALGDVLGLLEAYEKDLLPWASALFPHLRTTDAELLAAVSRLISLKPALYRAYVTQALSAPKADLPRMLEVIANQLYWASLFSKSLLTDLKAPLLQLRQQAAQRALTKHVQRLDLALQKLGVEVEATTAKRTGITLGKKLAEVGTEGGPPLAVPAAFSSAWQGVDGPEPFDSGNSDYERACDVSAPALISIGKGKGLVLDQQQVTVHRDPKGLLLHAYGDPAEADAKRWKRVGELEIGPGGLVVQDAALSGKRKSRARATVPLAVGVYDVLAHPLGGFGNDFSAVRLELKGAGKPAKLTTTKPRGARTAKASARRDHRSRPR